MWSNDEVKAVVKRNDCWELEMKMQKKDVCKLTRKINQEVNGGKVKIGV